MEKYLDLTDDQLDNLLFNFGNIDKSVDTNKKCQYCGSNNVGNDGNVGILCLDCGSEINEIYETTPNFEGDDKGASSYGCPSSYFFPKSSLGTNLKIKGYNRVANLQRQGQMPYKEKSLMDVMSSMQEKCKKYCITQKVIDTAKVLYKQISDCKHKKGERKGKNIIMRCINRRSMIAACVFYACKLENETRSPKEIGDIYDLEVKHVNRGCRKFLDYIDINKYLSKIKCSQAVDFISRYSIKLNLSKDIIETSKCVCENIHKLDIASTHEPPSIASASILLVCNYYKIDINKKNIGKIFDISDVTISKTYRKIYPYYKIVMDTEITEYIEDKIINIEKDDELINLDNIIIKEDTVKKAPKKPRDILELKVEPEKRKIVRKKQIIVEL